MWRRRAQRHLSFTSQLILMRLSQLSHTTFRVHNAEWWKSFRLSHCSYVRFSSATEIVSLHLSEILNAIFTTNFFIRWFESYIFGTPTATSPNFSQLLQSAYSLCVTNICIISVTGIIIMNVLYLFLPLDKSWPTPCSSHQVYKRLVIDWNWKKYSDIRGETKTATFGLDFSPQSPLGRSGFEMMQYIRNLKHPPGALMTDFCFNSDISPTPPLILQGSKMLNLAWFDFDNFDTYGSEMKQLI